MASLITKLFRGSFLRIFNILVTVLISFFMMPFVISSLGERWYGLWIFAAGIVGYYGFLDFGLSGAVQKFISKSIGEEDYEKVKTVFNSTLFLYSLASLLVILTSVVIVYICPQFVNDPKNINTFKIVIFLIGVDVALSFSARAFIGFLASNIRHDVVEIIDIAKMLMRTALIVFFLKRGYGIISLAFITIGVNTIQYLSVVLYVLIRFKKLELGRSYIRRDWIKKLLGFSTFSFIVKISDRIRFHTDSLVISGFLGLSFVTHYNIGARVAIYYQKVIRTGMALMFPVFSQMEGKRDFDNIRDKYLLMIKLTSIFSVFLGGLLIIFGKAFISRWMGDKFIDSYGILVILVIGMLFSSVQTVSSTVLFAVSKHKQFSLIVSIEALSNLFLSLILVQIYGITGVAWGTTLPILITSLLVTPVYTSSVIGIPLSRLLKVMMSSLSFGTALYFLSWFIIGDMIEDSYLSIIKFGFPLSVIMIILNVFILLDRRERRYFKIPI